MVVYLLLTLENTVIHIADLCTHRMTYHTFHAIATKGSFSCYCTGETSNFVAICTDIACEIVLEITDVSTIAHIEFNTLIFHLASIDPLVAAFAHHTNARHIDQNVLRLFVVPLERTIEGIVEKAEIKTKVGLRGGFPLQIIIAELIALETAG